MPFYESFFRRLNPIFSDDGIANLSPDDVDIDARDGLRQIATAAGIETPAGAEAFFDSVPPAIGASLRAAARAAIQQGKPVTFSWAPAYDFEIHVWESQSIAGSPGGVTIQLRSRYPGDAHPSGSAAY